MERGRALLFWTAYHGRRDSVLALHPLQRGEGQGVQLRARRLLIKYPLDLPVQPPDAAGLYNHRQGRALPHPESGPAETAVYQFDTLSAQEQFTAEDGTELAYYSYQLLTMSVENMDELAPGEAEAAARNLEGFNGRMESLMEESVARGRALGEDAQELHLLGSAALDYYEETRASCYQAGRLVSVRLDTAGFSGGAHANSYTSSALFDLGAGQFLAVQAQLHRAHGVGAQHVVGEDHQHPLRVKEHRALVPAGDNVLVLRPEVRARLQGLRLLQQQLRRSGAEGLRVLGDLGGVDELAGAQVKEGAGGVAVGLVVFSHYVLGPYTMGTVELRLDCEQLAELVGAGGMARLGIG